MPDLEKRLDDICARALDRTLAPSLNIAATSGGEIVYVKAFGNAASEAVYNIASVTKQFTSASTILLARDKKISLDDKVAKWFPELTRAADISVRDLLAHSSGYPDYYPLGFADEEKLHDTPPDEIVRRYATRGLQFEPGTSWSYSNTGYHIVGLIVEKITGRPFGEVLTETVLRAAGMDASFFNDPPQVTAKHVRGYTRYCMGPQRAADGERAGWTFASGGIASTARDLARWHTALMQGAMFSHAEIAEMTSPYTFRDGTRSPLGLGWFTEQRGPYAVIQHNGGIAGFSSQTVVSLSERCSVVVLSNGDHVPTGALATQIFEAVLPGATSPALPAVDNAQHAQASASRWLLAMRDGNLDRSQLEAEIDGYLTHERMSDASEGLHAAGDLEELLPLASGERGGIPWYLVRASFAQRKADVVLRETHAGRLAEFNVYPLP